MINQELYANFTKNSKFSNFSTKPLPPNTKNHPNSVDVSFKSMYGMKTMVENKHEFNFPVFACTTATTFAAVLLMRRFHKKHPPTLNQSRIKELMTEVLDLSVMALGSIGGGLATGLWLDRNKGKDQWKKVKEANYQLISNNITPVLCQGVIIAGIDKFCIGKDKIKELKQNIELNSKKKPIPIKKWQLYLNKVNGFRMLGGIAGILSGLVIGSKITNVVNNKVMTKGEKYNRKMKPQDLLIQTDNLFSAMALLKIPYVKTAVMPFLSMISGYEAGTK